MDRLVAAISHLDSHRIDLHRQKSPMGEAEFVNRFSEEFVKKGYKRLPMKENEAVFTKETPFGFERHEVDGRLGEVKSSIELPNHPLAERVALYQFRAPGRVPILSIETGGHISNKVRGQVSGKDVQRILRPLRRSGYEWEWGDEKIVGGIFHNGQRIANITAEGRARRLTMDLHFQYPFYNTEHLRKIVKILLANKPESLTSRFIKFARRSLSGRPAALGEQKSIRQLPPAEK